MENNKTQFEELQKQVIKLQSDLAQLSAAFYKNNFTSSQTFSKDCIFTTRLKVPHYSTAPAVCDIGDLIEVGGKLYICTVANTTFTLVGSQT